MNWMCFHSKQDTGQNTYRVIVLRVA